jgi:PST family polysaccharide transporter
MAATHRRLSLVQRAFRPRAEDLGRSVAHGAALTFLSIGIRTAITFGSMAVLARLLTPSDFGHVAMATVVTELAALFSNFGFGAILIQRAHITRIQMDTMFWAALGLGTVLTLAVQIVALFAGQLFNDETVGELLRVMGFMFMLDELTVVPRSLMNRMLMFRQDMVVQIGMMLFRAGTGIVLAWMGWGVWSLAGASVAGGTAQMLAYTFATGYRPRLRFSRSFLASTWRTNGGYFGNGFLFYANANLDLLLIGRMLGASSLGYYQNARALTDEIRARIAIPLQQVLFPAFSALQHDMDRFRDGILRSGRLLSLAVVPIGFGIGAVAEEMVLLLYGDQWLDMVPILKIISVGAGLRAATTIGIPIFNATDRLGLSFKLYLANTVISLGAIVVGNFWGLTGVAYAVLFGTGVSLVFFRISIGLVDMKTRDLGRILGAPTVASMLMFGAVVLLRDPVYALSDALALRLGVLIAAGVLAYVVSVLLLAPAYLQDVRNLLKKFTRKAA